MSLFRNIHLLLAAPLLLLASCAGGGGDSTSGASSSAARPASGGGQERSLDEWVGESSRDNGFKKDAAGNYVPKSNKRSSFEHNRESAYFKGDYAKKDFKTKDYSKKSWWGDTQYKTKNYEGDTDGSRFQSASRFQGAGAREANTTANLPGEYRTSEYGTSAARETGKKSLSKPSDAETDIRRRVYTAPAIVGWKEQRSMSMGETKGFLGR